MKHPQPANASSTSAFHAGVAPLNSAASGGTYGDRAPAQARAIALEAVRELCSPLGALRVLIEGSRGSAAPGQEFADRALEELERAQAAAKDILAWTLPRKVRSTQTSLGEIAASLTESLSASDRRRTHLVCDQDEAALETDAPLLVEAFARTLRHAYAKNGNTGLEVMVHIHAAGDIATFNFIQTGNAATQGPIDDAATVHGLADEILAATVLRLGGKTSIHDAEGHRCAVISLPLTGTTTSRTESVQ